MRSCLASLVFFCVLIGTADAANVVPRLDGFFRILADENHINGNVLVAEKGEIIYSRAFGFADAARGERNAAGTRFVLASVSKPMTAVAILQLVEKGRLRLDDRLVRYIPDFPYPDISIRNLLSHTSGLPNTEELFDPLVATAPERIITDADVVPALRTLGRRHFAAGEKFEYSNTNYNLLALLVERRSGEPFARYMARHVFRAAGMGATFVQPLAYHDAVAHQALEYEKPLFYGTRLVRVTDDPGLHKWTANFIGLSGAGNVVGTAGDLLKFDQALYAGTLLQRQSLEEMFTPIRLNDGTVPWQRAGIDEAAYGLGWYIFRNQDGGKVVFHSGGVPGMNTFLLRNIDKKQLVVAMDNAQNPTIAPEMYLILSGRDFVRKRSLALAYADRLLKQGADAAAALLGTLRADPAYDLSEQEMNRIGLQLQGAGEAEKALETLKLNMLIFPASANVYDSYAEVLLKNGRKEAAAAMYRRSLALDAGNDGAKAALRAMGAD
jgi:CubicO group peptidase (beta-lactamase class C family)